MLFRGSGAGFPPWWRCWSSISGAWEATLSGELRLKLTSIGASTGIRQVHSPDTHLCSCAVTSCQSWPSCSACGCWWVINMAAWHVTSSSRFFSLPQLWWSPCWIHKAFQFISLQLHRGFFLYLHQLVEQHTHTHIKAFPVYVQKLLVFCCCCAFPNFYVVGSVCFQLCPQTVLFFPLWVVELITRGSQLSCKRDIDSWPRIEMWNNLLKSTFQPLWILKL